MQNQDKVDILIVDDLPEKLLVLESILECLGENIISAKSGREALRRVLEREFAVILLDVNMPDMDGFETASLIRQRKQSADVPIIFVTSFGDDMHATQGYSLGAVDYILSPVVPEILRTKVGVFVDLYRKTQQIRRQADERITLAREQAARAAAEMASSRSHFLAEASGVLASSLQYESALHQLAHLMVPFLGDLSAITLLDDQRRVRQTEVVWRDESGRTHSASNQQTSLGVKFLDDAILRTLANGISQLYANAPIGAGASTTAPGDRSPKIQVQSAIVVPLRARDRAFGTLLIASGTSARAYTHDNLIYLEDVANRTATALDNARLYRDVQEADRRKNEFLAMLAHELRNPLAPISNAMHIFKTRGPLHPDLEWARQVVERQVKQMVRLVDDLLDVSRITRGKITLQKGPIEASALAARAIETSRPLIDSRKHEFTVSLPDAPLWVNADSTRMDQVLGNLLNNAAKYTEPGGKIGLFIEEDDGFVVLRVRDSGIEIPPEMLATVFDLFTQVDRSLDRSQGGLGIGLTIVRRIVEMHGGSVRVESLGHNQGSEFVVRLPVLEPPPPSCVVTTTAKNGEASKNGACYRMMVVDDNVDSAKTLSALLTEMGHDVRHFLDGPSALEAAGDFLPNLVLLDIGLPGMEGYKVAARIRQTPGLGKSLVAAVTGHRQADDRRCSDEAGFDCHLVKPVDVASLESLIAMLPARSADPEHSATH